MKNTSNTLKEVKKRPALVAIFGIESNLSWTDDKLEIEAKKYQTRSEFEKNSGNAYSASCKRGKPFLDKICSHMYWIRKENRTSGCTPEAEAKKYRTRFEFSKGSNSAYNLARRQGKDFMDKICAHMYRACKNKWTDDALESEAKKYGTRSKFAKDSGGAYYTALKRGKDFMNKICAHMSSPFWTDKALESEAKKYKTRVAFQKGSSRAYSAARRRGKTFFDKICAHMMILKNTWTNEMLELEAKKYTARTQFNKGSKGAYCTALKRGKDFMNRICAHMVKKLK